MTKKDYVKIAGAIRPYFIESAENKSGAYVGKLIHDLCRVFYADNPRFDYDKFATACGIEKEPVRCPSCRRDVWDVAKDYKLNKCWNCNLVFE